jgi:hypothetical protein
MAKDSSQLAREYIDGTLKARASLGHSAKPSKAAYERAVRMARVAMDELIAIAGRRDQRESPQPRKAKTTTKAR